MVVFGGVKTAVADVQYSFTTIDVPGAISTAASGINASGQIVGGFTTARYVSHGFLLDTDGSITTIDVPDAAFGFTDVCCGINASSQIVGSFTGRRDVPHGFLLDTDGSFTTIDVPGAGFTYAYGINDSGQIVGEYDGHGFLDSGGSFTTIDVPSATFTEAIGINASGQIVGIFGDAHGQQASWIRTAASPPSMSPALPIPTPSGSTIAARL
jgi:probable HAF family extracellular repeat protein